MLELLHSVEGAIAAFDWGHFARGLRNLFIFLDLAVIIAFIVAFWYAVPLRPKFVRKPQKAANRQLPLAGKQEEVKARWARILEKAPVAPPQSFVIAIIEADKCVDDVLKDLGLKGEHMADRLEKLAPEDFKTLDKLWRAHRVRNDLVHTPDFRIDSSDAEEILKLYEAFLKELEVL